MSDGPIDSANAVFARVGEGFLDAGGTSGPLFGMWFRELSNATAQSADTVALAAGVAAGMATVQRLGQAQVGDKTMVDAMYPATEAMTGHDLAGRPGGRGQSGSHWCGEHRAAARTAGTLQLRERRGRGRARPGCRHGSAALRARGFVFSVEPQHAMVLCTHHSCSAH
jgi:dihydroxyacetone kinase-like protein